MSRTDDSRAALVARWYALTRDVLPAMSRAQSWPIALDHCFMRVCLDAVCGAPWHATVARPAIRHLTPDQLAAAVAVAEGIAGAPDRLPALNEASLRGRRRFRAQEPSAMARAAKAGSAGGAAGRRA